MSKFFQRIVKIASYVLPFFFLTACVTAPGQKFSGLESSKPDFADVYLYRNSAVFASAATFKVDLNGGNAGELYNASYLNFKLPAGKHTLKVAPGGFARDSDREIDVEAGKTYFFQYEFTSGLLANIFFVGASIEPRNEQQALADLKELKSAK